MLNDTNQDNTNQDNTKIHTTKAIYPQIYAYTLPTVAENQGWIKIGYTERENVDTRILEQTHTAAIHLDYEKLWAEIAKFRQSDEWFKDHQFHRYLRLHKGVPQRPNSEWFYYNGNPEQAHQDFCDFVGKKYDQSSKKEKSSYQLRAEQREAVEQTLAYIHTHPNGEFLWNAKPRFGKTLTTYDLVCQLNAKNVLIVTNRPAIANSWFDDFEKFIAHQSNFAFVSTSDSLKDRPVLSREQFLAQTDKSAMLAFISLQDLKGAVAFGGKYDKLSWVKTIEWDLLVIDEAHEGVDTLKTDVAFDNIPRQFTLHLSGTPFKAVASGKFASEAIYNWSYADEQAAKTNWQSSNEQNNPYETLPQLNLFSYQMSAMLTDTINQGAEIDGENMEYAFDLNEFFATDNKGKFQHEKAVKKWLNTLTQNEKYPFSDEYRHELKHTFWLLDRVDSAKALAALLKKHPVFENYTVVLAVGDGKMLDHTDEQQTQTALERVRQAVATKPKTITLSVGQLTTGVTIPEWTAVLMLSNIKSPALYMQAAFRAQNPWRYTENGELHQKQNAYVFDFAPERTLMIYDEFANNLFERTACGGGSTAQRTENIQQLLNFFPVIAEDNQGKMVALDVNQVLTIPKMLKAREVVRRGFMSNLLFQNIGNIFANPEAREILEHLNPMAEGKNVPASQATSIDTQEIQLDENGNPLIEQSIVIAQTQAHFGEKRYQAVNEFVQQAENIADEQLAQQLADQLKQITTEALTNLAQQQGLSQSAVEMAAKKSAEQLKREVEKVQQQQEIQRKETALYYQKILSQETDSNKIAEVQAEYEAVKKQQAETFAENLQTVTASQTQKLATQSTQEILQQGESLKQKQVEDDIRSRLRGFSRTIPAFLMAYGTEDTRLANFDHAVSDEVFYEVTGITLDQFRQLRDTHQFFDENVFNQSVQEFLAKRTALTNYFDESVTEDIFDYIPPQKTNQIFTPKNVVKMMLDKLEAEDPTIFQDKNRTFADLYTKSGLYLTEIIKRLYQGLETQMPDPQARLNHILTHQIYAFAPSEIIHRIVKNFILGVENANHQAENPHITCLDLTDYAMGNKPLEALGDKMKFDVVVGNPPYQESQDNNNKGKAIYHHFYNLAEKLADQYCLISPARFLFNGGLTPAEWNKKMLNDEHLKVVYFNPKSSEIFPTTDIMGGSSTLQKCQQKIFTH